MNQRRTLTLALLTAIPLAALPVLAQAEPTPGSGGTGGNVVDGPNISEGAKNAPGTDAIATIIDAIGYYAIVACLIGLLLSGLILAIGPRLGFTQASTIGKVGIFASLGVAFLVGMAAPLVNYFYNAGA